jgi:hypothetical protein
MLTIRHANRVTNWRTVSFASHHRQRDRADENLSERHQPESFPWTARRKRFEPLRGEDFSKGVICQNSLFSPFSGGIPVGPACCSYRILWQFGTGWPLRISFRKAFRRFNTDFDLKFTNLPCILTSAVNSWGWFLVIFRWWLSFGR